MRILIVSRYFPPANTMAAVRLGKLARHLVGSGHDVRVLTEPADAGDLSLPVELDAARIDRVAIRQRNGLPRRAGRRSVSRLETAPGAVSPSAVQGKPSQRLASRIYADIASFPDKSVAWLAPMTAALRRRCATWRPDLLYVSGPPFSPFIGVSRVARSHGIPWVAEFRDRWADDPYTTRTAGRRWLDSALERWVLRDVAGIVTVSDPWARDFADKFGVPVRTVMNGLDTAAEPPSPATSPTPGLPLRLLHCGTIYRERRDPGALFSAIRHGGFAPSEVQVVFHGPPSAYLARQVARYGVGDFVDIRGPVPHHVALRLQQASDVLLLLQWNDPRDDGNVPGKTFEYFAARRPILGMGPLQGIPATLVRSRSAGLFSNDPSEIAAYLGARITEKRQTGVIPALPASVTVGLDRDAQLTGLARFLADLLQPETSHSADIAEAVN